MWDHEKPSILGYNIVYSPDDGGYYAEIFAPDGIEIATTKIYKTENLLIKHLEEKYKNVIMRRV